MIWQEYVIFGWALFSIAVNFIYIGEKIEATFGGAIFQAIFWLFVLWTIKTQMVPL